MKCYFNNRTITEDICSDCVLKNECVALKKQKQETPAFNFSFL